MSTIKLKLPFDKDTSTDDRHSKLFIWAKTLVDNEPVKIIDEQHFETKSFIVIENNKPTPRS